MVADQSTTLNVKLDINPDSYVGFNLDTGCGCGCGCLPRGKSKRRGKNKRVLALVFASFHALGNGGER
jgi:hypothetical protein